MNLDSLSFNDKLLKAHRMAVELGERLNAGDLAVSAEAEDMICAHADGLVQKHLWDIRDGRCSISMSLAFDPEESERQLDEDLRVINEFI